MRFERRPLWTALAAAGFLVAGGAGCEGQIGSGGAGLQVGEGGSGGGGGNSALPFEAAPLRLRRLTVGQYENTIHSLLGASVQVPSGLPPDTALPHQFINVSASEVAFSNNNVEQFEVAGIEVSRQVFEKATSRVALVGCTPTGAADPCVATFLQKFGRLAFRRPLAADESTAYLAAFKRLVPMVGGDVWGALQVTVGGMLQSPFFLYLVEEGERDPNDASRMRFTAHELASRLSYFLWDAPPDQILRDAAESGSLSTPATLRAQARRMLTDARARSVVRRFFSEYLALPGLAGLAKNAATFPLATPSLMQAMRTELELTLEDLVFERKADLRDLFTSRTTFVNAELAGLYGLPTSAAAGTLPSGFRKVEHPATSSRRGLLGSAGFLALKARVNMTSATLRGKFIRQSLLCAEIPPPPPNVADALPPDPVDRPTTARDKLARHRTDPNCSGCHDLMDPLGLPLEHFDGLGGYRDKDHGLVIDTSGSLNDKNFDGPVELGALLREEPKVQQCLVRQFYRFATGHLETGGEESVIADLSKRFSEGQFRLLDLWAEITASEGFRFNAPLSP